MEQQTESTAEDYLFQLPTDVTADAEPLIGITGLDIVHHATHYLLWHLLTAENRSKNDAEARAPLKYMHIRSDHEFPPKKSKRSYEMGGQVSGIFKANWFHKHLYELPAVICHFVDLDWDNPAFEEKEIEVSSKVRTLRAALMGRGTQFCLCLLQSKTFAPSAVPLRYSPSTSGKSPATASSSPQQTHLDAAINERHASLARACDIPVKQVYTLALADLSINNGLNKADNVNGASGDAGSNGAELQKVLLHGVRGMESMLLIVSHTYFAMETKRVRAQRDNLQRVVNSAFLLIRHQIKQAFFQEMRQEPVQAVQFYRAAYLQLKEIRITPAFMHEVKTIAMILMYKICRLLLGISSSSLSVALQTPSSDGTNNTAVSKFSGSSSTSNVRDAIDFFEAFRAHYKIYQGLPELEFEHEAWLSRQHTIFADLLARACEINPPTAISSALMQTSASPPPPPPALTTRVGKYEHPGVFYRDAATHCQRRKFLAYSAIVDCGGMAEIEKHAAVPPPVQADFYGQRRVLKQVSQPPALYQYLLAQETRLNYPRLMIALLSKALLFYRHMHRGDSRRMQWMLLVMIGDEYSQVNEFELALTYLSKALNEYQQERWYDLVARVAPGTLNCAIRSANLIEFILCSLTLQSIRLSTTIRSDYSVKVWNSLQQLLANTDIPDSVRMLGSDAVENAWKQVLSFDQKLLPLHVRIDAYTACAPLFELDAAFAVDSCAIAADEMFKVRVAVRSLCRAAFVFHSVRVTLLSSPPSSDSSGVVKKHVVLNNGDEAVLSFDAVDTADTKNDNKQMILCTGPVMDSRKDVSVVKLKHQSRTFHISEVSLTHKCASKKFILHWIWQFPDFSFTDNHDPSKTHSVNVAGGEVNGEANSANLPVRAHTLRWRAPSASKLLPPDSIRTCRVLPRESKIDVRLLMPNSSSTAAADRSFLCYGETFSAQFNITFMEDAGKVAAVSDLRMVVSAVAADDDDCDEDEADFDSDDDSEIVSPLPGAAARAASSSRASVEAVRPASRSIQASPLLFADKPSSRDIDASVNFDALPFDSFVRFRLLDSADAKSDSTATVETPGILVFVNRPRLSEQQSKLDVDEDADAPQNDQVSALNTTNKISSSRDGSTQTVNLVIRGSYVAHPSSDTQQPLKISFAKRIELLLCEALKPTLQIYSSLFKRSLSWEYVRKTNRAGMIQPRDRIMLGLKLTNNVIPGGVQLTNFGLPNSSSCVEWREIADFPLNVPYRDSVMLNLLVDMERAVQSQSATEIDDVELGTCTMQWTRAENISSSAATSSIRFPTLPVAHVELPFLVSVEIAKSERKSKFDTIMNVTGGPNADRTKICELRRPLTCFYVVKSVCDRWQEFSSIALEPIVSLDFLVSGAREWFKVQLGPHQQHSIAVCLVPMRSGHISLPKLVFKRSLAAAALDDIDADEIDEMVRNIQNEVVYVAPTTSLD